MDEYADWMASVDRRLRALETAPRSARIGYAGNDNQVDVDVYDQYSTFGGLLPSVTLTTGRTSIVSFGCEWRNVGFASNFVSREVYLGVGIDGELPNPFDGTQPDLVVDLIVNGTPAGDAVVLNFMPVGRSALITLTPGEHTFQLFGYAVEANAGQTFPPQCTDSWVMVQPVETTDA